MREWLAVEEERCGVGVDVAAARTESWRRCELRLLSRRRLLLLLPVPRVRSVRLLLSMSDDGRSSPSSTSSVLMLLQPHRRLRNRLSRLLNLLQPRLRLRKLLSGLTDRGVGGVDDRSGGLGSVWRRVLLEDVGSGVGEGEGGELGGWEGPEVASEVDNSATGEDAERPSLVIIKVLRSSGVSISSSLARERKTKGERESDDSPSVAVGRTAATPSSGSY